MQFQLFFDYAAKLLIEAGHVSSDVLIDSKPIRANTEENNPKNPDRMRKPRQDKGGFRPGLRGDDTWTDG